MTSRSGTGEKRLRLELEMSGKEKAKEKKPWARRPATAYAFFRLCDAYRRERRVGHYKYETHFYTQLAKAANDM